MLDYILIPVMRVSLPKKVQTRFKLKAVRAFPRELLGFLIGRRSEEEGLEIVDIWYPPRQKDSAEEDQVTIPQAWWIDAMEHAAGRKLIVLGTCHSHTYRRGHTVFDPVQSQGDLGSWEVAEMVTAIANVVEREDGRKHCSPLNFYGRPTYVDVNLA